jgi:hypothetical protein
MQQPEFLRYFINEEIFLIDPKESTPTATAEHQAPILVVTPEPPSDEDVALLGKIFASVKIPEKHWQLSSGDYNLSQHTHAFLFGGDHKGADLSLYEKTTIGTCTVIRAHSLTEIATDKLKKRELWTILKSVFSQD